MKPDVDSSRQPQVVTAGTAEPLRVYNLRALEEGTTEIDGDEVRGGILDWEVFEVAHPWPGETDSDARRARAGDIRRARLLAARRARRASRARLWF